MSQPDTNLQADLQVGPTENGMVRILISVGETEIPLDFYPDEAEEIASELRAAASQISGGGKKKK
ncbi:MAG: DUF6324 family protein [Alphaproteobacteria bacterium]